MYERSRQFDYEQRTIERPVFIIGSPRSGTTFLYRVVRRHPHLAFPTQASDIFPHHPIFANRVFDALEGSKGANVAAAVSQAWAAQWVNYGFDYAEGYHLWQLFEPEGNRYARRYELTADDVTEESRRFYRMFVRKHLSLFDRPRFVNKAPLNALRIGYLNVIFPDALFVHLLRDGRAVARSILEKTRQFGNPHWGPQPEALARADAFDLMTVRCGCVWEGIVNHVRDQFDRLSNDRHLTVRYEDFIEAPHESVNRFLSFCELDPSLLDTASLNRAVSTGRNEKWRREFSADEIRALESAIGDTLALTGYSLSHEQSELGASATGFDPSPSSGG